MSARMIRTTCALPAGLETWLKTKCFEIKDNRKEKHSQQETYTTECQPADNKDYYFTDYEGKNIWD